MSPADQPLLLHLIDGTAAVTTIAASPTSIGRDATCEIQLHDRACSRRHARLWREHEHWWVADCDSANGSFVNEWRLREATALQDGDRLRLGNSRWLVRLLPPGVDPLADAPTEQGASISQTVALPAVLPAPPTEGLLAEHDLKSIFRYAGLVGWTGALWLDDIVGTRAWFVDGVPRRAMYHGRRGLEALVSIAQRPHKTYRLVDGERNDDIEAIPGTAEELLFAMFGPTNALQHHIIDLDRAENIQRHVLGDLPQITGYDLDVHYEGASSVSGDCYEVGRMADGRWLLAVGDVAGHGVQAALVVAGILKTLRLLRRSIDDLRELTIALNAEIAHDLLPSQFCTMSLIALDPGTGDVEILLVGHHPVLLLDAGGKVHELGTHAPALGLVPSDRFGDLLAVSRHRLTAGETLLQCTDGLLEAADKSLRCFDLSGLAQSLQRAVRTGQVDAHGLVDAAVTAARAHAGRPDFDDDCTLLALRRVRARDGSGSRRNLVSLDHPTRRSTSINVDRLPLQIRRGAVENGGATTRSSTMSPDRLLQRVPPRRLARGAPVTPADYRCAEELGEGGTGTVYAAEQIGLRRPVAIKLLHGHDPQHQSSPHKLLAEAQIAALLDHPGIVPIYDVGIDPDRGLFYAMKKLQGQGWDASLTGHSERENIETLLRLCDAVAFAHAHGVLHRDLKPANVLLGAFGEVVLVDWGLAVFVGADDSPLAAVLGGPSSGMAVGTPAYMAPEQARADSRAIDQRTDVYLLGAILFEIITGQPPHAGESTESCVIAAAENRIATTSVDGPLIDLALRTMATDPADRPAEVAIFQEALKEILVHRESITLCEQAELALERALQHGDYTWFGRALTGFEQAAHLWPDSRQADSGRLRAAEAYARLALERGDLELAASLIDPDEPDLHDLLQTIELEQERRRAQSEAAERLRQLEAEIVRDTGRSWQVAYEGDFSPAGLAADWEFDPGTCRSEDGCLLLAEGQPQAARLRMDLPGDVRIEFTAEQRGTVLNDISVFLAAVRTELPGDGMDSGYLIKFGCYDNSLNLLIRQGRRLWTQRDRSLRPGKEYRFRIERVGDLIACTVNGEALFAIEDPQPLAGSERSVIGVGGWLTPTIFRDFRISRLGKPLQANLLKTAQRHLILGHFTTAHDLFGDVLESAVDEAGRAEAKAGLARARTMADLQRRLPEFRTQVHRQHPGVDIRVGDHGLLVDAAGQELVDLEALRGLPISELWAARNRIGDLTPLTDMPLRSIEVYDNQIVDLAPLAGHDLAIANFDKNQICDLGPLAGSKLSMLLLADNDIADLGPLHGSNLASLYLRNNQHLEDLAALSDCPLTNLDISRTRVTDLAPLAHVPLTRLLLQYCPVTDLTALRASSLVYLDLTGTTVIDVTPLRGVQLRGLAIRDTAITDLSPLHTQLLEFVDARGCTINDWGPAGNLRPVPSHPGIYSNNGQLPPVLADEA